MNTQLKDIDFPIPSQTYDPSKRTYTSVYDPNEPLPLWRRILAHPLMAVTAWVVVFVSVFIFGTHLGAYVDRVTGGLP
jgi:hypothetical protein